MTNIISIIKARPLGGWRLFFSFCIGVVASHSSAAGGEAPLNLGAASRFAVLAGSEISSVPTSAITGDVGLSPAPRSDITGLTPVQVTGTIFAADDGGAVSVMLTDAQNDLTAAYNDAAGRSDSPVDVTDADIGGRTLHPALYKSSGTLSITGNLTLDAQGDSSAIYIFQVSSSLSASSSSQVILSGGAKAANIYWQVGTSAAVGTSAIFQGVILANQSITFATGATLNGQALARISAVTLDANTITIPPRTPPSFASVSRGADGSVTLGITSIPDLPLTLQTSTDLVTWTPLTTFTPSASPSIYADTAATGAYRFYRAIYQ